MKACTKCGEVKPLEAFGKHSKGRLQSRCRACRSIDGKAFYEANKERILSEQRKYLAGLPSTSRKDYRKAYYKMTRGALVPPDRQRSADKETVAARHAAKVRRHARRTVSELRDTYVRVQLAKALGIRLAEVPGPGSELVEIKREQLTLRRIAKRIRNSIKEQAT